MAGSDLRKRISELGDIELVRMLTVKAKDTTAEELALAEAEAKRRGLPIDPAFIPRAERPPAKTGPAGKYEVAGIAVVCPHCRGESFHTHDILLNTRGLTFFRLDWLNRSATALICANCGHVQFFGDASKPR